MVVFKAKCEVRAAFHDEVISLEARTVGGVSKPAVTFSKRFYNVEIDGQPALVRFRDNVTGYPKDLQKGQMISVSFTSVEVDGDVTNVFAQHCELIK